MILLLRLYYLINDLRLRLRLKRCRTGSLGTHRFAAISAANQTVRHGRLPQWSAALFAFKLGQICHNIIFSEFPIL